MEKKFIKISPETLKDMKFDVKVEVSPEKIEFCTCDSCEPIQ